MRHTLQTLGHATLVLMEDGAPLIATDPWLLGSVYWRSWWLERDPTEDEIALVRGARHVYITHSHPDHFHMPSLRRLGKPSTLHPRFPNYPVPSYLAEHGFPARVLDPWAWYQVTPSVRVMSIPTFLDDSILILDTPNALVFNLNDARPSLRLLRGIRERVNTANKSTVVLKSYSPASSGITTFRDGQRIPHTDKRGYVRSAQDMADALGADIFIPFASQAFFGRPDTIWANAFKVDFPDLQALWTSATAKLTPPYVSLDLQTLDLTSSYVPPDRRLDDAKKAKIEEEQARELEFIHPSDFDHRLKEYLDEIVPIRLVFPRGIGWRLATSGTERFYNTRTRRIEHEIPRAHDFAITIPDKVLYEALCNNILTDLGVTMFIRVDTNRATKVTYGAFMLMGLHDYGYFRDVGKFITGMAYYAPTVLGHVPSRDRGTLALG